MQGWNLVPKGDHVEGKEKGCLAAALMLSRYVLLIVLPEHQRELSQEHRLE
jgi:hypothetical protein